MANDKGSIKGSVPLSTSMKAVGRGMAKVKLQEASKKTPMGKDTGGGSKPYGGGVYRGTQSQTSGKTWKGVT